MKGKVIFGIVILVALVAVLTLNIVRPGQPLVELHPHSQGSSERPQSPSTAEHLPGWTGGAGGNSSLGGGPPLGGGHSSH